MLDGLLCIVCGEFIDFEGEGFPRACEGCEGDCAEK